MRSVSLFMISEKVKSDNPFPDIQPLDFVDDPKDIYIISGSLYISSLFLSMDHDEKYININDGNV